MPSKKGAAAAVTCILIAGSGVALTGSADAAAQLRDASHDQLLQVFRQALAEGKLRLSANQAAPDGDEPKFGDFSDAFRDSFKDNPTS